MRFRNTLFSLMGLLVLLFCVFSSPFSTSFVDKKKDVNSIQQNLLLGQTDLSKNIKYHINEYGTTMSGNERKDNLPIYQTYKTVVGKRVYKLFEKETPDPINITDRQ